MDNAGRRETGISMEVSEGIYDIVIIYCSYCYLGIILFKLKDMACAFCNNQSVLCKAMRRYLLYDRATSQNWLVEFPYENSSNPV